MPYYGSLSNSEEADRRTARGLLSLKSALDAEIPPKRFDRSLLIATWNIREFGAGKYGGRDRESLHYIAEIINRFDLVAVQEVREDLTEFRTLLSLLGAWWKPLLTDVTAGNQGNSERTAFLYDSRKLSFKGLAGEVVLPPIKRGDEYISPLQICRSPFITGFQAGWFKFMVCTTHLYYGASEPDEPQRLREMRELCKFLSAAVSSKNAFANNMILLGDFNIFRNDGPKADQTFLALEENGFRIPAKIKQLTTNAAGGKHYDQIAFIAPSVHDQLAESNSGAFNFFNLVYKNEEQSMYQHLLAGGQNFGQWRTFRMSDHFPLWTELTIDFSVDYLKKKTADPAVSTATP